MMKNIDLNNLALCPLNNEEMLDINGGGSFSDGENAGAAAGEYVKRILKGVAFLRFLTLL